MADLNEWVIRIADFTQDPVDDAAFGVVFDIAGPLNFTEMVRVSFSENFIKVYFKVPWFKDLVDEERKILKTYRDLFVRWALARLEGWLLQGARDENRKIIISDDKDLEWAKAVEIGKVKPKSVLRGEREYILSVQ